MSLNRFALTGFLWIWGGMLCAQLPLSLDPSFQTGLDELHHTQVCFAADVARLSNGRLLVSGDLFYPGNSYPNKLEIFNEDGSPYNSPTNPTALGYGDGQIRQWGNMFYVRGGFMVSRFFGDGTLDTSFDMLAPLKYGGLQGGDIYVRPDGGILMAGYNCLKSPDGLQSWYGLIGFTNTGVVDSFFTPRSSGGHGIYMLQPLADGRLLAAGPVTLYEGQTVSRVFRIWADGSLDTTFHSPITTGTGWPRCVHELADGKLLLGGTFTIGGDTLHLIRTFPDGALDTSFNTHLRFRMDEGLGSHPAWMASVNDIEPYGPDKFIVVGSFYSVDNERRGALAMIDTTGNLLDDELSYYGCDSVTNGVATIYSDGGLVGIKLLSDGYYYIYGRYTGFDDGTWYPHQRMISRLFPVNVGAQARNSELPISIFPNPGSAVLQIEGGMQGAVEVYVLDGMGRTILTASGHVGSLQLSIAKLVPGVYLVEVRSESGTKTLKWIKQ